MRILCFLVIGLFTLSCKKDNKNPPFLLHSDYSPLEEGRYVIYEAIEIIHDDDALQHDTLKYWLKTSIGKIYLDNGGRSAREFLRYTSSD
jgi:hypothetical protein